MSTQQLMMANYGGVVQMPGIILLAHLNSANGATTFTDNSTYAHSIANRSGIVASNAQSTLSEGTSGHSGGGQSSLNVIQTNNEFNLNNGVTNNDLTIRFRIYPTNYNDPNYPGIIFIGDHPNVTNQGITVFFDSGHGGIVFTANNTAGSGIGGYNSWSTGGTIAPLNAWSAWSCEIFNNKLYLYKNGTELTGGGIAWTGLIPWTSTTYIGLFGNFNGGNGNQSMIGYLQEVYINNGTALAGGASSYTVESSPFSPYP